MQALKKFSVFVLALTTFLNFASADVSSPGSDLISRIVLSKARTPDHFNFSFCLANRCESLGSPAGYTSEQIERLNGGWRMLGATAMGVGEGIVILYLGASGAAVVWGVGNTLAVPIAGAATGVLAPSTAIHFIKKINPFDNFKNGQVERRMELSLGRLLDQGKAAVVVYQNPDFKATQSIAQRIQMTLLQMK